MARNIEIKARVESLAAVMLRAAAIADQGPIVILQDDTFYHCPNGRLKLRKLSDHEGDLIFYQRTDQTGPKTSNYLISKTTQPDQLAQVLLSAFGISGCVKKHRTLYLAGRTRIHLDRVEGLGEFVELEVVLADNESQAEGSREAQRIMARLDITPQQLVAGAYLDLIRLTKLVDP